MSDKVKETLEAFNTPINQAICKKVMNDFIANHQKEEKMDDKVETLKPCPFCGEMPHLEEDYEFDAFSVYCGNIECVTEPFTDMFETAGEAIKAWNTRVNNYESMYKKTVEHNRQLIDDIEKADSDYFKMKENRDSWRKAFYKSVEEFKRLSDICDKLIIARNMLTEENHDLKDEIETLEHERDSLEDEIVHKENAIMTLTKENKQLKGIIQLCGSY